MEKLKDIWASILAHVSERTTNPLSFSFAISWAFWNYRFLVVLFSAESPAKTFAQIDAIYANPWVRCGSGFFAPLLTALAYVYIYPYVTEKVVRFYRARQIAISNAVKQEESGRLMRPDEVSQIVRLHESDLRAANEELTSAQQRVAQLRDALAVAEAQKKDNPLTISPQSDTADEAKIEEARSKIFPLPPKNAEEVIEVIDGPDGNPVKLFERHLLVLTAIAESSLGPPDISINTRVRKYWVDESLIDLLKLSFATQDKHGYLTATNLGRTFLRNVISGGKWSVPR